MGKPSSKVPEEPGLPRTSNPSGKDGLKDPMDKGRWQIGLSARQGRLALSSGVLGVSTDVGKSLRPAGSSSRSAPLSSPHHPSLGPPPPAHPGMPWRMEPPTEGNEFPGSAAADLRLHGGAESILQHQHRSPLMLQLIESQVSDDCRSNESSTISTSRAPALFFRRVHAPLRAAPLWLLRGASHSGRGPGDAKTANNVHQVQVSSLPQDQEKHLSSAKTSHVREQGMCQQQR